MRLLMHSVDVDRPVGQVFDTWSRIEEFPRFMGGVASVRVLDERSSHWVTTIARERREFGAVITEAVPPARIAWESRGLPHHRGLVEFQALPGDRTRVTVVLEWQPSGLFDHVGDRTGLVGRQFARDVDAFAAHATSTPAEPGPRRAIDGRDADQPSPADAVVDGNLAMLDRARGHAAASPTEIPPRGWRDVLKRTFQQVKSDNVSIIAAGVAFYFFLALIPAFLAVVSVYGLVADPADIQRQLDSMLGALPREAADFVTAQLETIVESNNASLGLSLVVSVGFALLSASKGTQALVTALNIAYDEEETRGYVKLRLLSLALTIGGIVAAALLVGGMGLFGRAAAELGDAGGVALSVVRWPLLGVLLVLFLAVLYRYAPDRDKAKWRWVTPGAALAVVLLLIGSLAFSFYVNNFGSYNETYGALAGIIVLLLWLFLTAYVIVLGAEFDAEAERQTAKDTTAGEPQPLGARDAYAADTVAGAPSR